MRVGVAVLLVAGCDQVWELEGRIAPDAAAPLADAKVCAPGEPFGLGMPVEIDGMYSVEAARFEPTQAIAYLSLCTSVEQTTCELYQSAFSQATNRFSFYTKLEVSAPMVYDSYATITPDAQTLVFGSTRAGAVKTFVSIAQGSQFIVATELRVIANASFANEPYLVGAGPALYLAGGKVGGTTGADIYRARGGPPQFGGASDLVAGVNSDDGEFAPVVSEDELEMFFASDRESTGVPATMPIDIFGTTRSRIEDPFSTPVKLGTLSTLDGSDWPVWLSPDGCDLFYINKVAGFATLKVARR